MTMKTKFLITIVSILFVACRSNNVVGVYKWPCNCFDAEVITLEKDSTFKFVDLLINRNKIIIGKYEVRKNKLYFKPTFCKLPEFKISDTMVTLKERKVLQEDYLYCNSKTTFLVSHIFKIRKEKIISFKRNRRIYSKIKF